MTMHAAPHPDDERLAAYAGGDADAVADRALSDHVAACERCRPIVDELQLLRGALAALPDVAPSRPLRLIPPVAPAQQRIGPREWLRRLAAPAMAAGAGLALIGAVGVSGVVNRLSGGTADNAAVERASASDTAHLPGVAGSPAVGRESRQPVPGDTVGGVAFGQSSQPRSERPGTKSTDGAFTPFGGGSSGGQPWLTLIIVGVAVLAVAAILRFSLTPRAG
ncbi:MAG: hypothetical protein M3R32_06890 [Chloroflexota bacterium]|nr:hypothetical protein [Chloroflexota bacterium]